MATKRDKKRLDGLIKFFSKKGRRTNRMDVFRQLEPDRIIEILKAVAGTSKADRVLIHEIVAYANSNPRAASEVTKEDIQVLVDLSKVEETMTS